MLRPEPVDENIIYESTLRRREPRILGLPVDQSRSVIGGGALHEVERLRPFSLKLALVHHTKGARRIPDCEVLVDRSGILNRHLPPAEVDHSCAELPVDLVQGCFLRLCLKPLAPPP